MIKFIPHDDTQDTLWMSSHAFSVIIALLGFRDALPDTSYSTTHADDHDNEICGIVTDIEADDIPTVCHALANITKDLASAGLTSLASESLFLLSVLPQSSGVHIERVED